MAAPPEWVPDGARLSQVVHMLRCATTPETGRQAEAMEALKHNSASPDFAIYLAHVFSKMPELGPIVQRMAGLVLKTFVEQHFDKLDAARLERVCGHALSGLTSPDADIRNTSANLIATILRVEVTDISRWPELPVLLARLLDSATPAHADAALVTLRMVAEDSSDSFEDAHLEGLVPRLIRYMGHSDARLRRLAAGTMNFFVVGLPAAIVSRAASYLPALAALARDPSPETQTVVIESFSSVLRSNANLVWPQINVIQSFVISCVGSPDDALAIAAANFWCDMADICTHLEQEAAGKGPYAQARNVVQPHLAALIPALCARTVASQEAIEAVAEADARPDREQDVRPFVRSVRSKAAYASVSRGGAGGDDDDEEEEEEEEEEEQEAGPDYTEAEDSSVRAAAGKALHEVSRLLQQSTVAVLETALFSKLAPRPPTAPTSPASFLGLESALFVVSCCGDAVSHGLGPKFPQLFGALLRSCADPAPLVRASAVSAIMGCVQWVVYQEIELGPSKSPLKTVVDTVCRLHADPSKHVQFAAGRAMFGLLEAGMDVMAAYTDALLGSLVGCMKHAQLKQRLQAYRLVDALAEAVGEELADHARAELLLSTMVHRYKSLRDANDLETLPLLAAFVSVAPVLGAEFKPCVEPLWMRGVDMMLSDLTLVECARNEGMDLPPMDAMCTGMELLQSCVESVRDAVSGLLVSTKALPLILQCMKLDDKDVHISGLALLGELLVHCWPQVQAGAPAMLPVIVRGMQASVHAHVEWPNNAAWVAAELVAKLGPGCTPLIPALAPLAVVLLTRAKHNDMVLSNVATLLGRLALHGAALVITSAKEPWQEWALRWAAATAPIGNPEEKAEAWRGLLRAIMAQPGPLMPLYLDLAITFSNAWSTPSVPADVLSGMKAVLAEYRKRVDPAAFAKLWGALRERTQMHLAHALELQPPAGWRPSPPQPPGPGGPPPPPPPPPPPS